MEKTDVDKRVGLVVGLLVIFMILNTVAGFFAYPLIRQLLGHEEFGDFSLRQNIISIGLFILTMIGNIIVAIWLNGEAKRLERNRLTWTVFPLFFGLSAAFLFYLIEIYNEIIFLRKANKRIIK